MMMYGNDAATLENAPKANGIIKLWAGTWAGSSVIRLRLHGRSYGVMAPESHNRWVTRVIRRAHGDAQNRTCRTRECPGHVDPVPRVVRARGWTWRTRIRLHRRQGCGHTKRERARHACHSWGGIADAGSSRRAA